MRTMPFSAVLAIPTVALPQSCTGAATVIDGDNLDMAGTRIRVHGSDAVELAQNYSKSAGPWACGEEATTNLDAIIGSRPLQCAQKDDDRFGRVISRKRWLTKALPCTRLIEQ